jgi:hypothetical protein
MTLRVMRGRTVRDRPRACRPHGAGSDAGALVVAKPWRGTGHLFQCAFLCDPSQSGAWPLPLQPQK